MDDEGGSQQIDLCPDDLNSSASGFASGQSRLDSIATTLSSALRSTAGMAGNDTYGRRFGGKYDAAAAALFHTFSAAVRAVGQASSALVTTANNYVKADHHSNPKGGKGAPKLYPAPTVFTDIMYPDPDPAVGPGHSSVPSVIAKYWPNGHQDRLRDAAQAHRKASTALQALGHGLHQQVASLTDNNSDDSIHAMAAFWAKIWEEGGNADKAPLSAAHQACDRLAKACDQFAHAIDEAHSSTEEKLAGVGIAVGLTSAVGILLTPFTLGASDAGAAALNGAEAAAILGGVELAAEGAVSDIDSIVIADVATELETAAGAVPEIETVDAETTEVSETLDDELAETEAREGSKEGGVDESAKQFNAKERRIADTLKDEGRNVKALKESSESGVRTPDAEVDGRPTEFKSLDEGATPNTVKNQLNSAKGQARDAIIDTRGSGLNEEGAREGLVKFLRNNPPDRMNQIRIIGDGYDITWP
ncbi:CdiA C-terminal domain-containing protein [Streptomyces sp. DW26H14]|uniref:CdiA C-terminal domain-containing protein n=1 Tax=Streptomyces sp. DW26H14 TaxID=3435395 RepID=UPI00403D67E1